ncbi:hypothetical protein Ddc_10634 [Ditylenchus destructor]|nr:hypothetical protein Ddc_10634 [Ditylenchus destructor]
MVKNYNDGNVTRAAIEGAAGGAVTGTVLAMMGPLTGPRAGIGATVGAVTGIVSYVFATDAVNKANAIVDHNRRDTHDRMQ